MSNFDTLFFTQYISSEETIDRVFHRHIFVMLEDVLFWIFFGVCVPGFFLYFDIFHLWTNIEPLYVHIYILCIYFIILYKIFDWYLDVWIATDTTLVEMTWKWFTPQFLYIPYEKIEGIEVRTKSWLYVLIGISDVSITLPGEEFHTLSSATQPKEVVQYLQTIISPKKKKIGGDSFDILLETLSGVVKEHLVTNGKDFITNDYVEKLDTTLSQGVPIDLRSSDEKTTIKLWKDAHKIDLSEKKESENSQEEK